MLPTFGLIPTNAKRVLPSEIYGRLFVLSVGQVPGKYEYRAVCVCACGQVSHFRFSSLVDGDRVCCGCTKKTWFKGVNGSTSSPHYSRWHGMLARCENPDDPAFF